MRLQEARGEIVIARQIAAAHHGHCQDRGGLLQFLRHREHLILPRSAGLTLAGSRQAEEKPGQWRIGAESGPHFFCQGCIRRLIPLTIGCRQPREGEERAVLRELLDQRLEIEIPVRRLEPAQRGQLRHQPGRREAAPLQFAEPRFAFLRRGGFG